MKRIVFFIARISPVLMILSVSLVMAEPPAHWRGPTHHSLKNLKKEDSIISKLNLTTEQLEEIQSLRESLQTEMTLLRSKRYELIAELRLLWMESRPNPDMIRRKERELHDLIWRIRQKVTGYRLSFRKILTSEQLSGFLDMGGGR